MHPHPRARYAPAAVHSAGNLRSASFVSRVAPSVCVTGSALLLSRRSSLFPPPSSSRTHRLPRSNPLSFSPFARGSVFLSSLSSSLRSPTARETSPRPSRAYPLRAPSAAFFRLFVLASSRAGNRRRLRRLRWLPLSRLVNRDSPSKRVAKSTKARKFLAREARERACQC